MKIVREILNILEDTVEEQEADEQDAIEVIHTLQKAGYQAVLAGGAVRDRAMGLSLIHI